jgi:hypothetical protein
LSSPLVEYVFEFVDRDEPGAPGHVDRLDERLLATLAASAN